MDKAKVIILGSCVSRVSMLDGDQKGHGIAADDLELVYFLDKQNIALAMMPPAFTRDEVELVTADQLWDKTRITTVKQSLNKDTLKLIMESDADYLIMDLFDFQTNFAVLGNTAFDTNAYEFMNTVLFQKYQNQLQVANFLMLPEWIYYPYVDLFFKEILKKFDADHIILNRFRANTYYFAKDGTIQKIPDVYKNPYQAHEQYNGALRKLEDYIIEKYQPYVVDISKYYMGDQNVWTNLQGAHFEMEFYHETFRVIKHIIREKPEQKVWDEPNFFKKHTIPDDVAFNVENMIERFKEFVDLEEILWLNVLDKLNQRAPEDERVKEFVRVCSE